MRYLLWSLLLGFWVLTTHTVRAEEETADLAFWGIPAADFHADKPRALSIPGIGGKIDYYWYWTFKFRYRTNLELLKAHWKAYCQKMEDSGAGTEEIKLLRLSSARLDATMQKIETGGDDETPLGRLDKARWKLKMYVTLRTDTGQILPDLSNDVVRNLVERQENKKFYTAQEIKNLRKSEVPETHDPDYGRGRWVNGIAVFTGLQPQARELELRVAGLGQRVSPSFVPGLLLYNQELVNMDTALTPTMRRVICFFYRKIGQSGEAHLDAMEFEKRQIDWQWMWTLQVYPGRCREVELTRDPEIEGMEAVTRRYIYVPYFIWNNTHLPQKFTVERAGVAEDIDWGGEKIRVTIYDDGGTDARWKNYVRREIVKRQTGDEEKNFVAEFEAYPVDFADVDVEAYYRQHFPELPYEPEHGDVAELKSKSEEFKGKLQAALAERKTADLERKAQYAMPEENRLFNGEIPAGKMVNGVAIMQWGVTDVEALIDEIIARLQSRALLREPAQATQTLLAEYLKLRHPPVDTLRVWTERAEPSRVAIIEMLAKLAENDLKEKGLTVTPDDTRRYGAAAPFAVLFNQLAWEKLQERSGKGITDAYFKVKVNDTDDMGYLTAQYQRFLPCERKPFAPMINVAKNWGTQKGLSEEDTSGGESGGGEEGGEEGGW